jgi:hypothetical protein
VNEILEVRNALVISLNYDTLFESCLSTYHPVPTEIAHYVDPSNTWALVKLHGSVDWAIEVDYSGPYFSPGVPADELITYFNTARTSFDGIDPARIMVRRAATLEAVRYEAGRERAHLYYPALSAPLGAEDEVTCPPEHLEAATTRISEMDVVNLLVIGYSGHDQEVVKLLRTAGKDKLVGALTVVDIDSDTCVEVASTFTGCFRGQKLMPLHATDGFTEFVKTGGLSEFFENCI